MEAYRTFDHDLEPGFYVCRMGEGRDDYVAGGPYSSPLEARVMIILFKEALELGIASFPGRGPFYEHRVLEDP